MYLARVPYVGGVPQNLTWGQRFYLPLAHRWHAAQLCPDSMLTLSPMDRWFTLGPTARMTPDDLWLMTRSCSTQIAPVAPVFQNLTSEPQMLSSTVHRQLLLALDGLPCALDTYNAL